MTFYVLFFKISSYFFIIIKKLKTHLHLLLSTPVINLGLSWEVSNFDPIKGILQFVLEAFFISSK